MKKSSAKKYVFGEYLKELREKKGVSLKEVEKAIGASNAYISQLETGTRKKLPEPERLRAIADYYNVTVEELLAKAGYYEQKDVLKESFERKINNAFLHVIHDPQFNAGRNIKPDGIPLDVKRFVVEMFSYIYKKSSFDIRPQAAGTVIDKNIVWSLRWKTKSVTRDTFPRPESDKAFFYPADLHEKSQTIIRYRVEIECTETKGQVDDEKVYFEGPKAGTAILTQTAIGEGVYEEPENDWQGYESMLLAKATEAAVRNALPKLKGINWSSIVKPLME